MFCNITEHSFLIRSKAKSLSMVSTSLVKVHGEKKPINNSFCAFCNQLNVDQSPISGTLSLVCMDG